MYCHYIGWCIGKCPLYRGVLYSECPLSELLYMYVCLPCCSSVGSDVCSTTSTEATLLVHT